MDFFDPTGTDLSAPAPVATMESVLIHHRIAPTVDAAREAGLIRACLGCGTVTGIDPNEVPDGIMVEQVRQETRDLIDWDAADCCPDADAIMF